MILLSFDEIPNFNDPKYEKMLQSICRGTCIFIGAGVSKIAGYRLWDELREAIVNYFWSNRERIPQDWRVKFDLSFCDSFKKHDILDSFDLLSIVSGDLFFEGIKAIFNKDSKDSRDTIFKSLGRLSVIGGKKNIFVTTNLDKGLQEALSINDSDVSIFPLLDNPPKYLSYVHGRIDFEHSWILTSSQYHHGYVMDGAPCIEFLRYIFETYNVVFIGYSIRDADIKNVIALTNKRKEHFWIEGWSRKRQDELLIRGTTLKENYNVQLVPYCIDKQGSEILHGVIESLQRAILLRG